MYSNEGLTTTIDQKWTQDIVAAGRRLIAIGKSLTETRRTQDEILSAAKDVEEVVTDLQELADIKGMI